MALREYRPSPSNLLSEEGSVRSDTYEIVQSAESLTLCCTVPPRLPLQTPDHERLTQPCSGLQPDGFTLQSGLTAENRV